MVTVGIRLLLDPAANRYYTVGLVLGLLVHEYLTRPERLPWMAAGAALLLEVPQNPSFPPSVAGWLRVLVVIGVFVEAARAPQSGALDRPGDASPRVQTSRRTRRGREGSGPARGTL